MKHLYNARDYFKSALLQNYSSFTGESVGFVSESLDKAFGSHGRRDYSHALLSVATIGNHSLRLVFNAEMGCDGGVCNCLKSNISRKTGIPEAFIIASAGRMTKAQLAPGDAIGHVGLGNSYGTLGGFTLDKNAKKAAHIVSNNHVLANSNQGNIGDDIYSQSRIPRRIGILTNYVPITFGGSANTLDIAVASLFQNQPVDARFYRGYRQPRLGERVTKTGATTGTTNGIVQSLDETVKVKYGGATAVFEDQVSISGIMPGLAFSKPGDSGSFIFGDNGDFIGLLFAGNGVSTNANHAWKVAAQLRYWNLLHS